MNRFIRCLISSAIFSISPLKLCYAFSIKKDVIAHRGASAYLPEHTLASYALAYGMGADFIEPDIVLSKDGYPIALHDIFLDNVSNVAEKYPHRHRQDHKWYAIDFTLKELKSLRVRERRDQSKVRLQFPKRFPKDIEIFSIPTLEEVILLLQGLNKSSGKQVGLYPEIKNASFHIKEGKDIVKIVYETLKKFEFDQHPESIFLQSFEASVLKRIKQEYKSNIPLIQLIGGWDIKKIPGEKELKEIKTYATGIGVSLYTIMGKQENRIVTSGLVRKAHAAGLKVHAYTARADRLPPFTNSFSELLTLLFKKEKIDGIFTDFPDLVSSFLANP